MSDDQKKPNIEHYLRTVAEAIDDTTGENVLFAVLLFDTNNYDANYISNARRTDVIQALRETADRLEKRTDTVISELPTH